MAIRTLGWFGQDSAGVVLPKADLREEGLVDEEDELEDCNMRVERIRPGVWMVGRTDKVSLEEYNELRDAR